MVPEPPESDAELKQLLRSLDRAEPPDLPLEEILERWAGRRRRGFAFGGLVAAAGILLAVALFRSDEAEAPVHLDLQVVDVPVEVDVGDLQDTPQEVRGP